MQTSFISEHTAELILVPELIHNLATKFSKITPLYYWASREGGRMSQMSFQGKLIKILALYPRRPKTTFPGSSVIQVKFNNLLFDRAKYFRANGIPVIAGVPLASKLEDIFVGVDCLWFDLDNAETEEIIEIDIATKSILSINVRIASLENIGRMIDAAAVFTWVDAIEKIKQIVKINVENSFSRMLGDLYKPIYMLVHVE
jgi:hypothetical protein